MIGAAYDTAGGSAGVREPAAGGPRRDRTEDPRERHDGPGPGNGRKRRKSPLVETFGPLVVDVAVPVGGYYLLRDGFGTGLVMSLALSSVVPALRTVLAAVRQRAFNGMAGLMVAVNVLSISLSFLVGDPRLMVAKDSGISSVIGAATLYSAFRGTPMMTAGLKPMLTKGRADRVAAWDRLAGADRGFPRLERRFSAIWGVVLLVECTARIVGAYTLPVDTMVWAGNVIQFGFIGIGVVVGSAFAAGPMERMLKQEAAAAS